MSMSVGEEPGGAIASINTTPLVDVMLVLLIIFLITIPVDKAGTIYWNDKRVADKNELLALIEASAVKKPQPEVHIRGDQETRYEDIGRVMYAIQRGGIVKVGFLTEPDHAV